jgi:hypothetical protein
MRVSDEAKASLAFVAVAAVGVGGFLLASGIGQSSPTWYELSETTVRSVVTLREPGRLAQSPVRVRAVTTVRPDGVRVVTRNVVSTAPVVRREVVTVSRPGRTVVETRAGVVTRTRTEVVPVFRTVTDGRTVMDERVVTVERVVTEVRTATVVERVLVTVVEIRTQTVPLPVTVTVPIVVTVTVPFP